MILKLNKRMIRKCAWIFIGAGAVLGFIGIILYRSNEELSEIFMLVAVFGCWGVVAIFEPDCGFIRDICNFFRKGGKC